MRTVHTKQIAKVVAVTLMLALVCGLSGCDMLSSVVKGSLSDMPYNGDVAFHEITVTIPENFIRDSVQSKEDLWIFERGMYTQLIILTRNDIAGDVAASMDTYAQYMQDKGADVQRTTFMDMDAVASTYMLEEQFCQEMLFACNGSAYAIALRGGTEDEFQSLLDTVDVVISETQA